VRTAVSLQKWEWDLWFWVRSRTLYLIWILAFRFQSAEWMWHSQFLLWFTFRVWHFMEVLQLLIRNGLVIVSFFCYTMTAVYCHKIVQLFFLFTCVCNAFSHVWLLNHCRSLELLWINLIICHYYATLIYCLVKMILRHSAISMNQQVCYYLLPETRKMLILMFGLELFNET